MSINVKQVSDINTSYVFTNDITGASTILFV
jgi:hypothetical protein